MIVLGSDVVMAVSDCNWRFIWSQIRPVIQQSVSALFVLFCVSILGSGFIFPFSSLQMAVSLGVV